MTMEQRIEDAVSHALGLMKSGTDINEAVLSVSKDLPLEATKRVVENINVSNFLDLFKSGEDKTKEFPLADSQIVLEHFGKEAADNTILDNFVNPQSNINNSFYEKDELLLKQADQKIWEDFLEQDRKKHLTNDVRLATFVKLSSAKKLKEDIYNEIEDDTFTKLSECYIDLFKMKQLYTSDLTKVANSLYTEYGPKCKPFLAKLGSDVTKLRKVSLIDDTNEFYKSAKAALDLMLTYSKFKKFAANGGAKQSNRPQSNKPQSNKQNFSDIKALANTLKGGGGGPKSQQGDASKAISKGLEGITGLVMSPVQSMTKDVFKMIADKAKPSKTIVKKIPDQDTADVMSLKYQQLFNDLINNDEILREKNPAELSAIYKTMIDVSPYVSMNKEIVRAYLRTISTQAALGAFDAKTLAELEQYVSPVAQARKIQ